MKKLQYFLLFIGLYFILINKASALEPTVENSSHVATIGWMNYVGNDQEINRQFSSSYGSLPDLNTEWESK